MEVTNLASLLGQWSLRLFLSLPPFLGLWTLLAFSPSGCWGSEPRSSCSHSKHYWAKHLLTPLPLFLNAVVLSDHVWTWNWGSEWAPVCTASLLHKQPSAFWPGASQTHCKMLSKGHPEEEATKRQQHPMVLSTRLYVLPLQQLPVLVFWDTIWAKALVGLLNDFASCMHVHKYTQTHIHTQYDDKNK